jgi:replication-associated recombination protein RarA
MAQKLDMTPVYEAMSALQKAIRRNEMWNAYYWALKLEAFNPKMLWNRLQVIVSEDIGRAQPELAATFEAVRNWYFTDRDKGKNGAIYLSHIISQMASGPKSRDADNLCVAVLERMNYEDCEIPVPDEALDMHTLRGKKMGRGIQFWWDEACKLDQEVAEESIKAEAKRIELKYWKKPKIRNFRKLPTQGGETPYADESGQTKIDS